MEASEWIPNTVGGGALFLRFMFTWSSSQNTGEAYLQIVFMSC